MNFSFHTRLLLTSRGYLGITTTSVREGDTVWVVAGSRLPLIFRDAGVAGEYRLVGGAYVHGFMHGEALGSDASFVDMLAVISTCRVCEIEIRETMMDHFCSFYYVPLCLVIRYLPT
ncbi:hypothetical protein N658DRAFT_223075 [Parathielavia hyrcaniae]|uniref:Uncharacterized protein n=1 Tax=Parathielavia hyrcaniae TaxID=113614 RepID=A0AAN6SYF5_9PEZI|nr:hypothetical protein N658DRAFT_223075 [Parathielavia hyrcaniae]